MSLNLESIVRKNIWNLAPYTCARDEFGEEKEVMLDANENSYGACINDDKLRLERYPDPGQLEIKQKLSALRGGGLKPENIFLGVGSDEAIDLLIRIFCNPGKDQIVQCPPTYGMYSVSAKTNDIGVVNIPLSEETFQLNVPAIIQAGKDKRNKLAFICTPNNPTGNLISESDIIKIIKNFESGLVVIDEAYVDFCGKKGWSEVVLQYPNVVVMQTFSKSFGLAAARLGMAYASKEIIAIMNKVKAPYNISTLTSDVANKTLNDLSLMRGKVAKLLDERRRLQSILPTIPGVLKVYSSDSNFLLVKFTNPTAVYNMLAANDVVVRNRTTQYGCSGCLRISVGTTAENDILIKALRSNLSKL
eukprot:TRINITY_DN15812_c0_g1_i1.p1 TRINITY_DN15812_c0_g1~~TRINITY_DN15812_c0_g1_i1.p1  ORF type:complete len:377 (+),score=67.82 TRINITY_DN15812_c0_g1_i1:51-1133(+)